MVVETDLNKTSDKLEIPVIYYKGTTAQTFSWIEMMNESAKILEDAKNNRYRSEIEMCHKKMVMLSDEKSEIRTKMVDFSLLSFANVIFALVGLPISKVLVFYNLHVVGVSYSALNILISIISLFFAWKIIRISMGYSFKRTF